MERQKVAPGSKARLRMVLEVAPPGFFIRAEYSIDGIGWRAFESLPYTTQLLLSQVIEAWARAHMK
jgi:hypothetical protein